MATRTTLSPLSRALMVFLAFASVFLALGTNDYTRADGALRCLEQDGGRLFLHGNNHLLYPVWVHAWRGLLGAVGVDATSALQVIRMTQVLMSLLAAASLALLYDLLQRLAGSRAALLATCLVGTSSAVIVHATSSAEPLPALFAAMAGMRAASAGAASPRGSGLLFTAGLMFALALASYQAMATIAGLGTLVLALAATQLPHPAPARLFCRWLAVVALGGTAGVVAIYGMAYHHEGIGLAEMPARFFALGGKPEVYAGLSLARLANVPAGLLEQSHDALPARYGGLRTLAAGLTPGVSLMLAIGLALWIWIGWMTLSAWRESPRSRPWWVSGTAVLTACLVAFPLIYWDPLYDKLWLVPLCGVAIAVAMAMAMRRHDGTSGHWDRLEALVAAVVIFQLSANVPAAVRASTSPTPHLAEAMALRDVVRPGDALILDFDPVSTLWSALYRGARPALLLPASTRDEAERWLNHYGRPVHARRLVFVSVLDHDERGWNDFIGRRAGIPFALLHPYRQAAIPVLQFSAGEEARSVRANYNRVHARP